MKLGEKSKFNIESADYLISKNLYAPSVHCSYYACFQLMKVVLKQFLNITYENIDQYVSQNRESEHAYVRREVLNTLKRCDSQEYVNFQRKVKDLYQYRINSDYKDIEILEGDASKACNYSKEFINYMKEKFHV